MVQKIDHIGIAVNDINEQLKYYEKALGLRHTETIEVPDQQVRVAMIPVDEVRIELLEPTSPNSAVAKFLAKKGEGIHHIAYKVDDIDKALSRAKGKKIRIIDDKPKIGAEGYKMAFLHPKSTFGVLTEFVESN